MKLKVTRSAVKVKLVLNGSEANALIRVLATYRDPRSEDDKFVKKLQEELGDGYDEN